MARFETEYITSSVQGSTSQSHSKSAGGYNTRGLIPVLQSLDSASPVLPTTCQVICQSSVIKVKFNLQVHSLDVILPVIPCWVRSRTRIVRAGIR